MARAKNKPIPKLSQRFIERFLRRIARRPGQGPKGDCWEFQGARNKKDGYGLLGVRGQTLLAHRLAFFLSTGIDPGDLNVLHHCDNPPCCRDIHLYKGTVGDNTRDMLARGRQIKKENHWTNLHPEKVKRGDEAPIRKYPDRYPRGDNHPSRLHPEWVQGVKNPSCKLSEQQVREIRVAEGSERSIGIKFGVSAALIGLIKRRKVWAHLP